MKKVIFLFGIFFGFTIYAQKNEADSTTKNSTVEISQIPNYDLVKSKIDLKDVVSTADEQPEFVGGMKNFKKRFFENFNTSDLNKKKGNDTHLYFIIEKTGYVKNFIAIGSNKNQIQDAEAAIKKVFERWKPAKANGQTVRYLIHFPVEQFYSSMQNEDISESNNNTSLTVTEIPDLEYLKSKIDMKDVVSNADEKPEFPGGINAFKRKYFESIEALDLKNNEKVDIRLYFVVEKTGYVRNVTAVSKNKVHVAAAEDGVKRMNARWKPAKLNGKPVRYIFYFPLMSKKY